MFIAEFLTVAIVHILAVVSPGPDFAVVTRNSLIHSRKIGIYTSLGIALGISVHVAYSLLGISLLISKSIILFNVIKYIGAAYLIYIGITSLRAKKNTLSAENSIKTPEQGTTISSFAAVKNGFLTNVLNPKATLFFLALFTQVISPATPKFIQLLYGFEMMIITFVWFAFVTVLFSNTVIKRKIYKVQHKIERVTGAVLILLGIKVAFSG